MDSSVIKHSNLLKVYGIDLDFSSSSQEKNLKTIRTLIDRLLKFQVMRLDALMNKEESDEKKEEMLRKVDGLKMEREALREINDIYYLIFYYIQNAYDEMMESRRLKKNHVPLEEDAKAQEYKYVYEQFSSISDVKNYINIVLPLKEHVDLENIRINASKSVNGCSRYAVSMYSTPRMLLDAQSTDEAIRVYSFGIFQYKDSMNTTSLPYEILGIVKKHPDGTTKSNVAVMYLAGDIEIELVNMTYSTDVKDALPVKITSSNSFDGKPRMSYKRKAAEIPAEKADFFKNIVFSDFILTNAIAHNNGFIGSVVEDKEGNGRFGKYRLVFNENGAEEVFCSLEFARTNPGAIKGMDTTFYGNNLDSVFLMVKYASLAIGERMECKEKEIGISQGE